MKYINKAVYETCIFIIASLMFVTLVGMNLYKHFKKKV